MAGEQIHPQIRDDVDLLHQMMDDMGKAPEKLRPAEFWKGYESRTVDWMEKSGLAEFRRQRGHFLSFGCGPQPLSLRLLGS